MRISPVTWCISPVHMLSLWLRLCVRLGVAPCVLCACICSCIELGCVCACACVIVSYLWDSCCVFVFLGVCMVSVFF